MTWTRRLVLASVLGIAAIGCTSQSRPPEPNPTVSARTAAAAVALQRAGPWDAGYTYTLKDLSSCQVEDAVTVLENHSGQPVRVVAVRADIIGDSPGLERRSFFVAQFKANTTTGAVGATFRLSPLAGHGLRSAPGTLLAPAATSDIWYDFVVRLDVVGLHPRPWGIKGIAVTYTAGRQTYTADFPQSVELPATSKCA